MYRPYPNIAYHRMSPGGIPSATQTREGQAGKLAAGEANCAAVNVARSAFRASCPTHIRQSVSPLFAAGVASSAVAASVSAFESIDTFLASAGAVFYDMGHTAWGHPVSSAVAAALLVAGVVCGEPLLDRLFGKIPHVGIRQLLARWFPGPGSALMGIAFVEGLGKVVAHHMTDTAAGLDVSYVQGLGALWFTTFFGLHTFLHHLRDDPGAAEAKLKAKLLCLTDDIPALALVLAS